MSGQITSIKKQKTSVAEEDIYEYGALSIDEDPGNTFEIARIKIARRRVEVKGVKVI